ncbi:hypothetical protein V3C99_016997 [Haemonchus contortus]
MLMVRNALLEARQSVKLVQHSFIAAVLMVRNALLEARQDKWCSTASSRQSDGEGCLAGSQATARQLVRTASSRASDAEECLAGSQATSNRLPRHLAHAVLRMPGSQAW